ncbi:MAG: sugar ABC transporter ATP-binding protein [Burkholderiaceae bacterium]|nr:sugar ABC transporter ATP-binding protein [Burkholderiaceae bacterium]
MDTEFPGKGRVALELRGISKKYPGVLALDEVDFDLHAGEVHALFGENGAGKSTLISVICGAVRPTHGTMRLGTGIVEFDSVREAREQGISAVFQEFSLVPSMTVAQNILLGDEPSRAGFINRRAARQRALDVLSKIGFELIPDLRVGELGRSERQMVEIAKALRGELRILILDEPTASLTERETELLFELVAKLKEEGVGIVYITHRVAELQRVADRVTVLRDGRRIATVSAREASVDQLVEMMTGRPVSEVYPEIQSQPGDPVLEIRGLSTASGVRGASFTVRAGEVVGVAGLVGCGKSELLRAAYGLETVTAGQLLWCGREVPHPTPAAMVREGFYYLPPDRREEGLVPALSSGENMALGKLYLAQFNGLLGSYDRGKQRAVARELAPRIQLAEANLERPVALLSGGNQQKVLFGRGLIGATRLYVFDEPTVGVDVGTRTAIYLLIKELCDGGAAVVVVSSDLPEVLHLSHRAYVMRRGSVVAELQGAEITEVNVLAHFFEPHEKAA